ncbi:MAG: polyhydroxyalkanoate synthesis regulator DNA-binding domain-containing protein [Bacteroidota bacterium]
MPRVIKRYENRKLYDTEAGKTVSLKGIARLIRKGHNVQVIDNTNDEDITAQTLTQIIHEQSKNGNTLFSNDLLHNVIRASGKAIDDRINQVRTSIDDLLPESIQQFMPNRRQQELDELRDRVKTLEQALNQLVDSENKTDTPTH